MNAIMRQMEMKLMERGYTQQPLDDPAFVKLISDVTHRKGKAYFFEYKGGHPEHHLMFVVLQNNQMFVDIFCS